MVFGQELLKFMFSWHEAHNVTYNKNDDFRLLSIKDQAINICNKYCNGNHNMCLA